MKAERFIPKAKVEERIAGVLNLASGKDVLHIGLGGRVDDAGATNNLIGHGLENTAHFRIAGVARNVVGMDINPAMIDAMRVTVPGEYLLADITKPGLNRRLNRKFDLVLFLEVIEHLDCFRSALENIRSVLKADGVVVISTVNAFCIDRMAKMLFRYESVHEEHTAYFSYLTMKRLLDMNGFAVEYITFTIQDRQYFLSAFDRFGYYVMKATTMVLPQYAEGVMVVARPH